MVVGQMVEGHSRGRSRSPRIARQNLRKTREGREGRKRRGRDEGGEREASREKSRRRQRFGEKKFRKFSNLRVPSLRRGSSPAHSNGRSFSFCLSPSLPFFPSFLPRSYPLFSSIGLKSERRRFGGPLVGNGLLQQVEFGARPFEHLSCSVP